jgi:hypothetical protein
MRWQYKCGDKLYDKFPARHEWEPLNSGFNKSMYVVGVTCARPSHRLLLTFPIEQITYKTHVNEVLLL